MNVLILHSQVPFFHGGAEVLVEGLRDALKERGHRVDIVGFPLTWHPPESLLTNALIWRMTEVTQSNGVPVDLVVCTKYPTWAVRHPNKVLWLVHQHRQAYDLFGTYYSELGPDQRSVEIRNRLLEIDRRGMLECRRRFAISQNVASRLTRFTGIDAETLYPPLPRVGLSPIAYEPFVLSAARHDPLKRIEALVEAWPWVDPGLRLVITSDGALQSYLERRTSELGLRDRVTLAGRVSNDDLVDLYNRCRAVYYAPLDEDFGYSAVEALAASKPVITASDSGGVLEFVEHGRSGLVSDLAPEHLAATVSQLIDERLARELGAAGPDKVAGLDWDHVVASLLGAHS